MKTSQKDIVLKQLRNEGRVTRNWCLSNRISRLSAIMLDLKHDGVNFDTEETKHDYIYKLLDKPKKIEEFRINGELVGRRVIW
jgi:hypothetical protein